MILQSGLIGTPLELFGSEPNQKLIFRAALTFANTKSWVTSAFTDFFDNCWGPNWWTDGRQIQNVEAIVQTQTPNTPVSDTNISGGAYGWDIRFKDTEGDLRHQSFYYNPTDDFVFGSSAATGCQTRKQFLMGYDNSGPAAVGVATGTFTPLAAGTTPAANWELQTTSYCIGNVTITEEQCDKWYLEQVAGSGCHTAPVYQKQHSCGSLVDDDGNNIEVWKKKLGSSTEGNAGYKIYQKVGETKPYKLVTYNCATGDEMQTTYYTTRNGADVVGSAHVTSQYEANDPQVSSGNDNWPASISRVCEDNGDNGDNGGGSSGPPVTIVPCDDDNATVLSDGSCGPCKTGYVLEDDICIATEEEEEEENNTLKWIGFGAAGLFGLLILNKLA